MVKGQLFPYSKRVIISMSWFLKKVTQISKGLFGGKEPIKIILLGLDAAGKTTLLYNLKRSFEEVITIIPTIGFNVETLDASHKQLTCWDVGGCDKIRPLWRHYILSMDLLIFVVDSNDPERLEAALDELLLILQEDNMTNKPLLILANKQDLPMHLKVADLIARMRLDRFQGRDWYLLPTSFLDAQSIRAVRLWLEAFAEKDYHTCAGIEGILYRLSDGSNNISELMSNGAEEREQAPFPITDIQAVKKEVIDHDREKMEAIKISWLHREDEEEEVFLSSICEGRAEVWDHYAHIRLAYVYITRLGIKVGFESASQAIQSYLSKQSTGQRYHATMTRFWCHSLAYSLCALILKRQEIPPLKMLIEALYSHYLLAQYEFWSGRTFNKWYTNAVMFSEEARGVVRQPDLLSLPPLRDLLEAVDEQVWPTRNDDLAWLEGEKYFEVAVAGSF